MNYISTSLSIALAIAAVAPAAAQNYGEWADFGVGRYEYSTKAKEAFGFADCDVTLEKRVDVNDPAVAQIRVSGLYKCVDNPAGSQMVMDIVYDERGNGTVHIPDFALPFDREGEPVHVTDMYSWMKWHYPDDPLIDLYEETSSFLVVDNYFSLAPVYFRPYDAAVDAGNYYVQGEEEKLYIGEVPDYNLSVSNGAFTSEDGVLSYGFDVNIGSFSSVRFALAEGELGTVDFAIVATAVKNDKRDYVNVTADGHVTVPAPTADATKYTLVAVAYDRVGGVFDDYKYILDYSGEWVSAGIGRYSDGFIRDFFDIEQSSFDVELERSVTNPTQLRIVNPYREIKPSILQGDNTAYDYSRNYYIVLDIKASDKVMLLPTQTGLTYEEGDSGFLPLSVDSRAYQAVQAGKTDEEIAELGLWGVISDDVLTFPKSRPNDQKAVLLVYWNDTPYYANDRANFRLESKALADFSGVSESIADGKAVILGGKSIRVHGASTMTVTAISGATIYSGAARELTVAPGLYIVTATTADGATATAKLLIR